MVQSIILNMWLFFVNNHIEYMSTFSYIVGSNTSYNQYHSIIQGKEA